jgi:hypothetical protein
VLSPVLRLRSGHSETTVHPEPVEGWVVKPFMLRRAQHERLINSIGLREIMEEYVFSIMDSLVSVSFSPGFLASLSRIGVFTVVLSFSSIENEE